MTRELAEQQDQVNREMEIQRILRIAAGRKITAVHQHIWDEYDYECGDGAEIASAWYLPEVVSA